MAAELAIAAAAALALAGESKAPPATPPPKAPPVDSATPADTARKVAGKALQAATGGLVPAEVGEAIAVVPGMVVGNFTNALDTLTGKQTERDGAVWAYNNNPVTRWTADTFGWPEHLNPPPPNFREG